MNEDKEKLRHNKVMEQIKKASSYDELPNVTVSNIARYLADNVYFDNKHLNQKLFGPSARLIASADSRAKDVIIALLKERYPGKSDEEYYAKYKFISNNSKIMNLIIEIGERNKKIKEFQDNEDLNVHKDIMNKISEAYEINDLSVVVTSDLTKRVQKDFNDNDFINFGITDVRPVAYAFLEGKGYTKKIDSLVYELCNNEALVKSDRKLLYEQVMSNLYLDKKLYYLVEELLYKEDRKLRIYKWDHAGTMQCIEEATTIGQLPPNLTESSLTSYLSWNSRVGDNCKKINSVYFKDLAKLLLSGKKWEDDEVKEELVHIVNNNSVDVLDNIQIYELLYNKLSKLPRTYYFVEEINACIAKQKKFMASMNSNVNLYLVPNYKGPSAAGNFYNCYINRGDNLDLSEIIPCFVSDVENHTADIDSFEWYVQMKYDDTFKAAGGVILRKDETIGNVNVFTPNDSVRITDEELDDYDKISGLYDKVNELFKRRSVEQKQFLRMQSDFLQSQSNIDRELDELRDNIDNLNSSIKNNNVKKRVKKQN